MEKVAIRITGQLKKEAHGVENQERYFVELMNPETLEVDPVYKIILYAPLKIAEQKIVNDFKNLMTQKAIEKQ